MPPTYSTPLMPYTIATRKFNEMRMRSISGVGIRKRVDLAISHGLGILFVQAGRQVVALQEQEA
jgi:hypothetical protein